jgi:hypothetical protein
MPRDVQNIVNPTSDPIIAIRISPCAVTCEVIAGVGRKVGILTALMIAVNGSYLARPG